MMNTLQRREIVKSHIIDAAVAKAAVRQSQRERKEAAKKLRKAMAATGYASRPVDTISYPKQAVG
jgi:ribosome recycling factor